MIIDQVKITVKAGDGGKGLAVFSRTKGMKGPTGGNGGNGGSIYMQGVSDLTALRQFRFKKDIKADDGQNGKSGLNDGSNAEDLTLLVPVGTIVRNLANQQTVEITKVGQKELIAKGGRGGRGNFLFRSSTNTTPKEFELGREGQFFELELELKMIADVAFVGLPNAGKSSLLNELSNSKSKVANYPFTTLEPNLGVYYNLILADIPGLIEGASAGKGLGIKFLKHIERTKVLFHLVSAESQNPVADYNTVKQELGVYNKLLLEKPEYIFLSKSDMALPDQILQIKKDFESIGKDILPISVLSPESLTAIKKILNSLQL